MTTPTERPAFVDAIGDELRRVARADMTRATRARRPLRIRTAVLAVLATLALVGAAGAAGLVPLPGGGGGPHFSSQEATGRFSPALTDRVAALGEPRTAADAMGEAARYVAGPDGPAPGSSLRVAVPPPAQGTSHASATVLPVWLVPTASGAVSMQVLAKGADGPASGFAADLRMVEQGHAWMTVDRDLIGLAPDGVDRVDVLLRGGAHVSLPVVKNVFGAKLDAAVRGVRLDG
ncbi:MAG TPA: hypothetical protein VF250_07635 [Conexibacter sp.]